MTTNKKTLVFSPFSLYHFFAPGTSQGATFSTFWCTFASKWLPKWPLWSHFVCPFRPEWPPRVHLFTTWCPLGAPATKKSPKWRPMVPKRHQNCAQRYQKLHIVELQVMKRSNQKSTKTVIKTTISQLRQRNFLHPPATRTPYHLILKLPGGMRVALRISSQNEAPYSGKCSHTL